MWHAAAYFDESDDNDRAYAVAGFLGHQKDTVYLHWAWQKRLLCKYNLEYFKASELEWGMGQFAQYRDNPAGDLHARFSDREKQLFRKIKTESIDLILEFDMIWGFGAVLMLPDYERLKHEYGNAGIALPAPYFFCSQVVFMETGFIMNQINHDDRPPSQKGFVRPVFDSQEEYSGRAKQMCDDFMKYNPLSSKYLLPPLYESDKDYLMLQAADTLAYECRRLLITEEYDKHIPERRAMTRLKEQVYVIYKLNYEALEAIMERKPDAQPINPEIANERPIQQLRPRK